MKIDMHCHVREGSIDSKVPIEEFIKKLQSKGIGECWLQIMTPIMDIGTEEYDQREKIQRFCSY